MRAMLALCMGLCVQSAWGAAAADGDLMLAIGLAHDNTVEAGIGTSVRTVSAPGGAVSAPAHWWRLDTKGSVLERTPLSPDVTTPLGSVWKLFVYDFLVTQKRVERPYQCRGQQREEVYCCDPGQSVSRDDALVKSCGLYFEPDRLGITAAQWAEYWRAQQAPDWLQSLTHLQPETQVSVQSLLNALARLPAQHRAREVLLDRVLLQNPLATAALHSAPLAAQVGARLRIKTWSWHAPLHTDQRIGGFAGWLQDGTPIWASASGSSEQVLQRYAAALDKILPTPAPVDASGCIEVALFDRYALSRIDDSHGKPVVDPGLLSGRYLVHFQNGNQIAIESRNDIYLTRHQVADEASIAALPARENPQPTQSDATTPARFRLIARLTREDYVARVLDREASAHPTEAAKALAIVARTYLLQNAARGGECLQINDSSHHQRVAPRPASAEARLIAHWTADLVLAGAPVRYHQTQSTTHQLSWTQASELAQQGWRYDGILANVFPRSNLARWGNPVITCQSLPVAEQWLIKQLPGWRERLHAESGYEETRRFSVCRLQAGKPYIDRHRRQIYVRNLQTQQDRLDLTHEYLHLAFETHPSGQNEHYIESLARRLLLE